MIILRILILARAPPERWTRSKLNREYSRRFIEPRPEPTSIETKERIHKRQLRGGSRQQCRDIFRLLPILPVCN